jgi:hypothetical protein
MQIANRIANTKFDCGMATSGMPVFTQFFISSLPPFFPPTPYTIFLQSGLIVRLNDLRNPIKRERGLFKSRIYVFPFISIPQKKF